MYYTLKNNANQYLTLLGIPLIIEQDLKTLRDVLEGRPIAKKTKELSLKEKRGLSVFIKRLETLPLESFCSIFTNGVQKSCRFSWFPLASPDLIYKDYSPSPEVVRQNWKAIHEMKISLPILLPLFKNLRISINPNWLNRIEEINQKPIEFLTPKWDRNYTMMAVFFEEGGFLKNNKVVNELQEAQLFKSKEEADFEIQKSRMFGKKFILLELECHIQEVVGSYCPPILEPTFFEIEKEKLMQALDKQSMLEQLEELRRIKEVHPEWFDEIKSARTPRL